MNGGLKSGLDRCGRFVSDMGMGAVEDRIDGNWDAVPMMNSGGDMMKRNIAYRSAGSLVHDREKQLDADDVGDEIMVGMGVECKELRER